LTSKKIYAYGNTFASAEPEEELPSAKVSVQTPSEKPSSLPVAEKTSAVSLSQRICEALRGNALSADELSVATGIGIGDLLAELTELEIDGKIRSMAGNRFTCI
jgi:predicted Rossmann fold nucleotide-binding protein DprA/Smf involved in DNA uptake